MSLTRREFVAGGVAAAALAACNRESEAPLIEGTYDLCVIGSGFAGLTIAQRAVALGRRTIVVEAGSFPGRWSTGAPAALAYRNSGEVEYPVNAARMIAVGGASNHWEGTVNRMRPSDFALRTEFGQDVDWPLSYDDLEPYYCRAERDLAVRGYARVPLAEPHRSCAYPEDLGAEYRAPELEVPGRKLAYFPLAKSRRDGGPVRLADTEAKAFESSPNGTLLYGHSVTRLVTLDGHRLDHAIARVGDAPGLKIRAKLFVLAAGVVASARLLMLSRSHWFPEGLGNGRDLVGRFFNVHPTVRWEIESPAREGALPGEPGISNRTYAYMDDYRRRGLSAAHFQLRRTQKGGVILKLQPEIEPRPENRVAFAESERDRAGDLVSDLSFSYGARDRRTFEAGRKDLAAQVQAIDPAVGEIQRSEKWRFHPAGTVRMAKDEKSGVVDPNGQLFGIDNLFVSGASTFPTSGTANPTATVVALAHRLADHLL